VLFGSDEPIPDYADGDCFVAKDRLLAMTVS
jgi:hypothetical protein